MSLQDVTTLLQKFCVRLTTAVETQGKLNLMKLFVFATVLAAGLAAHSPAGETLRLKLEPDHDCLLAGSPREVVVKIDLSAIDQKHRRKRLPLNLSIVLDRSGSMTGAKIEKARQGAMEVLDHLAPGDTVS